MGQFKLVSFGKYIVAAIAVVVLCIGLIVLLAEVAVKADNVNVRNISSLVMFCLVAFSPVIWGWTFTKLSHLAHAEVVVQSEDI